VVKRPAALFRETSADVSETLKAWFQAAGWDV